MRAKATVLWAALVVLSCRADDQAEAFFSGDASSRIDRLDRLPMDQQWKIFKYGNQVRHPPATVLASPIAKRGKVAVYYILDDLNGSESDLDYRDALVIFQTVQWGGYYNVCGDGTALERIQRNETRIADKSWKTVYAQMFNELCRPRGAARVEKGGS